MLWNCPLGGQFCSVRVGGQLGLHCVSVKEASRDAGGAEAGCFSEGEPSVSMGKVMQQARLLCDLRPHFAHL